MPALRENDQNTKGLIPLFTRGSMKKKKTKPIGKLVEEASVLLQLLVRVKASDDNGYCSCVSCGVTRHYKEMQGGHYIPRGNSATRLLEENVHPQCRGCNGFGMKYGDAEKQYTLYLIDTYGREMVDELIALKGATFKWSRIDLQDQIKGLKDAVKAEKSRIGVS